MKSLVRINTLEMWLCVIQIYSIKRQMCDLLVKIQLRYFFEIVVKCWKGKTPLHIAGSTFPSAIQNYYFFPQPSKYSAFPF